MGFITHGKRKYTPFPSRAGSHFGKGMQVRDAGNVFIFTAEAQRTQSFRSVLFFDHQGYKGFHEGGKGF